MGFCLSYLFPQFKDNDERTKKIRDRGLFYSYFITLLYMLVIMLTYQLEIVMLTGYQTVCLLVALMLSTTFLSFVVLSKRY